MVLATVTIEACECPCSSPAAFVQEICDCNCEPCNLCMPLIVHSAYHVGKCEGKFEVGKPEECVGLQIGGYSQLVEAAVFVMRNVGCTVALVF